MAASRGTLLECFDIDPHARSIALVGAGGKTSLLFALAKELLAHHENVITTTTTKIFTPTADQSPCLILLSKDPELATLVENLSRCGHVTVGNAVSETNGKVEGLPEQAIAACLKWSRHVIIEADGAAGRPVKAPEAWEPVIPDFVELVIPVVGLDCLGKPASDRWVFRLHRFLSVTGLQEGQTIGPESVVKLLNHPEGSLKGVPTNARVVPFLNKLDLLSSKTYLEDILRDVWSARIRRVVIGKLHGAVQVESYSLT